MHSRRERADTLVALYQFVYAKEQLLLNAELRLNRAQLGPELGFVHRLGCFCYHAPLINSLATIATTINRDFTCFLIIEVYLFF
jgi:hypothetical protein